MVEMGHTSSVGTAAVLAVMLGVMAATPAQAGNDLGHRMPDNTPKIKRTDLSAGFTDALEWVRVNEMNPTNLDGSYTSDITVTNINVVDSNYGAIGWVGMWDCASWGSGNTCKRGDVYLNQYGPYIPGGSYDATERRSLVCEEVGHAVGLAHRLVNEGCMSQEWDRTRWTNDHDNVHINNWY